MLTYVNLSIIFVWFIFSAVFLLFVRLTDFLVCCSYFSDFSCFCFYLVFRLISFFAYLFLRNLMSVFLCSGGWHFTGNAYQLYEGLEPRRPLCYVLTNLEI
jgi:hypothetical protein